MKQEKAFLDAFDRYADALYRHAFFRISDKEKAKDLVSDTFTKTWDYVVKGNTVRDFKPFLYRTLNHLIIDEYRKKHTESLDAMLDEQEVPEGAFEELVGGGREELEFSLDAQQVTKLLTAMPDIYKEAVVMRYLDGLSPKEISALIKVPVNVVSVRIHRGMAWLAKEAKTQNL